MTDYIKKHLNIITLIAFALGILFGVLLPGIAQYISFIGDIYISVLKLLVIPLLMAQIITGIASAAMRSVGRRVIRTVLLFVAMFAVSFCIMAVFTAIVRPGEGAVLSEFIWQGELADTTVAGFFKSIFTDNILAAMSTNSILPCIIFAFAFGAVLGRIKGEKTIAVVDEIGKAFGKLLEYAMWLAPFGVFALICDTVAQYGAAILGECALYIAMAWAGCIIVTLLVMILPVWAYAKISPVAYIKRVSKIWVTSLSTCSSAATLPTTIRVCEEDFGLDKDVTSMVAPLGCTIHMCGGAVSFCLLSMFTMQMSGISIGAGLFLYMLLVATLINMAAPGIPGGGIVIGATYLSIIGAPLTFIGLYSGIYRVLDMIYTTVNVTGDVTACILIAEHEKRKK